MHSILKNLAFNRIGCCQPELGACAYLAELNSQVMNCEWIENLISPSEFPDIIHHKPPKV